MRGLTKKEARSTGIIAATVAGSAPARDRVVSNLKKRYPGARVTVRKHKTDYKIRKLSSAYGPFWYEITVWG